MIVLVSITFNPVSHMLIIAMQEISEFALIKTLSDAGICSYGGITGKYTLLQKLSYFYGLI